jgi:hypothetical protein
MNILLGIALLLVDLHAGLPAWWTWNEGPPVAAIGVLILALERRRKAGAAAAGLAQAAATAR